MAVKEAEEDDALDDVDPEKENKPEKQKKIYDKDVKPKTHHFKKQKVIKCNVMYAVKLPVQ